MKSLKMLRITRCSVFRYTCPDFISSRLMIMEIFYNCTRHSIILISAMNKQQVFKYYWALVLFRGHEFEGMGADAMTCLWSERAALWSSVSPSTFTWAPRVTLTSLGLYSRTLYLLSHLTDPEIYWLSVKRLKFPSF